MLFTYLLLGVFGLVLIYMSVVGVRLYISRKKFNATSKMVYNWGTRISEVASLFDYQTPNESSVISNIEHQKLFDELKHEFEETKATIGKASDADGFNLKNYWKIWVKLH